MKLAIMQPYFFPYLGYWQLLKCVDVFVSYDEGHYIKQGWMNRNRILRDGKPEFLLLRVSHANANKSINEITLVEDHTYRRKQLKSLRCCYAKAPYFKETMPLIENIMNNQELNLFNFLTYQIIEIAKYLDIEVSIQIASQIDKEDSNTAADKIISICNSLNIQHYINAVGGKEFYDKQYFDSKGIQLQFLHTEAITYHQKQEQFVSNLSIIDVLMYCGKEGTKALLDKFVLE